MKKKIGPMIIFAIVLLPVVCLSAVNLAEWKYYKNVNADIATDGLVRITLDDEIFSGSNKNLSDIRVIEKNGKETPFKIISGKQERKKIQYPVRIINNSFIPAQYSWAIMDLENEGKLVNSLSISTTSENFQRNVKVYGSNDMSAWNILRDDAYIYDYTDRKGSFKSQNTEVSFPESTFRYFKLEISDEENIPVKISAAYISQYVDEKNHEMSRSLNFSIDENEKRKSTEILADLGMSGIPVGKLSLQSKDSNFNRGVLIFSSSDNDNWKLLGQSYIFRYNTPKFSGENMQFSFSETTDRYLKVEVLNGDDEALVFEKCTAFSIYREIVFQKEKNKEYQIIYGNQKSNYPEYDIEEYFQYLDLNNAQNASLSIQKNNSSYIPEKEPLRPLSERMPYLFPSALSAMAAILLFLVYKFFKK